MDETVTDLEPTGLRAVLSFVLGKRTHYTNYVLMLVQQKKLKWEHVADLSLVQNSGSTTFSH